ncbi:MAG: hypothetical protein Tsb008_12620 [Rhodothalassiaceae bacterium]
MDSKRYGIVMPLAAAALLLVSACAKRNAGVEEDMTSIAEPAEASETVAPPSVPTDAVETESLDDRFGAPTQSGLESFAGDRIFFAFDSAELSSAARQTLQSQAEWLLHFPRVSVLVEGHADERGTREYNIALGERRANATRNYLVALGVSPDRIRTISYGKERPAVLGSGEAVWSQNRRAVLKVEREGA